MPAPRPVFVTLVDGEAAQRDSLLLAASLRCFGGSLSRSAIQFFVPEGSSLPGWFTSKAGSLGVDTVNVLIPEKVQEFPLASFPFAAAYAEENIDAGILVWLASETMILREPSGFLLPGGKGLGVRPVHHLLIGSRWGKPIDAFWEAVYRHCGLDEEDLYPMRTVADGVEIRPYFNSGVLAARPEEGVMAAWRDSFLKAYRSPEFTRFYGEDPRYRVFIHQAILTAVAVEMLGREEIQELSAGYNYPLHLYRSDSTKGKPNSLEELTTLRFESTFREPGWRDWIPASDALKNWITGELA